MPNLAALYKTIKNCIVEPMTAEVGREAIVRRRLPLYSYVAGVIVRPPILTEWMHLSTDPYAIRTDFNHSGDPDNQWHFARSLVQDFLMGAPPPVVGDVQFYPGEGRGPQATMEINSPDGTAAFRLSVTALRGFLYATYRSVPLGAEEMYQQPALDEFIRAISL
jgi:hypothetical protein